MRPRLVLVALVFALPLLHPVGATAAVHVPRGQVVHEIKVVGDDVRVDGRVDGSAIVIGGDLLVGSRGQVSDVTIIGGHLRTEEGARVTGDLYQLAGAWPDLGGWSLALALVLLLAARLLLVWLVVSAAELLAGGAHVAALARATGTRPLRTLAVGALAGFGLGAASILLAITVLGLAVAGALWGLLLVATVAGVALALAALESDRRARRLVLAGLAVPIVGDALAALAAVTGLGALLRYTSEGRSAAPRAQEPLYP